MTIHVIKTQLRQQPNVFAMVGSYVTPVTDIVTKRFKDQDAAQAYKTTLSEAIHVLGLNSYVSIANYTEEVE